MDSTILDAKNKTAIIQLCELPFILKKWKLQYRSSRDGFAAKNFYDKCDGIGNTSQVNKRKYIWRVCGDTMDRFRI